MGAESIKPGNWDLSTVNGDQWTYPSSYIEILEGESVTLPVSRVTEVSREDFSLIRKLNDVVTDDCYDKIKLVNNQSYHMLTLDNLE